MITIIAVCSLIVIVSCIEMPMTIIILLVVFVALIAIVGVCAAVMINMKADHFECQYCKALFVPAMGSYAKGVHTLTKRKLICPKCGKVGTCKRRTLG